MGWPLTILKYPWKISNIVVIEIKKNNDYFDYKIILTIFLPNCILSTFCSRTKCRLEQIWSSKVTFCFFARFTFFSAFSFYKSNLRCANVLYFFSSFEIIIVGLIKSKHFWLVIKINLWSLSWTHFYRN